MKQDRAIQIQAYLDGALPAGERREVEASLAGDPEARSLLENLRRIKGAVAANELERKLPESRDFYWSQIQRQLSAAEQRPPAAKSSGAGLFRWFPQLAPFVALLVVAIGLGWHFKPASNESVLAVASQEIANAPDEADAITFYSPEAQMTVVWVDFREN